MILVGMMPRRLISSMLAVGQQKKPSNEINANPSVRSLCYFIASRTGEGQLLKRRIPSIM